MAMTENQNKPLGNVARMIVYIPGILDQATDFANQVYNQAIAQKRQIVYLTIDNQDDESLANQRQLSTLIAITGDNCVTASVLRIKAKDRLDAIRRVTHPGDLVVWPEGCALIPDNLERELGINQQILPGKHLYSVNRAVHQLRSLHFWLFTLIALAGFTYLEFSLVGQVEGYLHKVILAMLFVIMTIIIYLADQTLG